ncbi:NADH:ubiquinone oxidoreductase [Limtongia smithiae]|uniref:NADH:ubiquinone oxidoreductase n=1 Tax=Limtongia smithiae TaxID=1125753 RepID=UPI0034CD67C1
MPLILHTPAFRRFALAGVKASRTLTSTTITVPVVPTDASKKLAAEEEKAKTLQAPNRAETWAKSQRPRSEAMTGPRFAQKHLASQPRPYAAIDLIAEQPVRFIDHNIAVCDGGRGVQGHPKVYINLDQEGPNTCTYCGLRYQQKHHH